MPEETITIIREGNVYRISVTGSNDPPLYEGPDLFDALAAACEDGPVVIDAMRGEED